LCLSVLISIDDPGPIGGDGDGCGFGCWSVVDGGRIGSKVCDRADHFVSRIFMRRIQVGRLDRLSNIIIVIIVIVIIGLIIVPVDRAERGSSVGR
jgi:hypothetical protein